MSDDEPGRKGGTSFPDRPDLRGRTARPTSVGPHHMRDAQEDPANPGITPETGYAAEIARNNEATTGQPAGKAAVVAPTPKAGREPQPADTGEPAEEPDHARIVAPTPPEAEAAQPSGAARDAPPLRGAAEE